MGWDLDHPQIGDITKSFFLGDFPANLSQKYFLGLFVFFVILIFLPQLLLNVQSLHVASLIFFGLAESRVFVSLGVCLLFIQVSMSILACEAPRILPSYR